MPLAAQIKLLRLLEEGAFERVGGTQTMQVETRVVAATNRDLPDMVEEGRFREDLYFRLQVFPLSLPPLRQRQEDIELLAQYFMTEMSTHLNKEVNQLSAAALLHLQAYPWPGHVRELEHTIQRAVIVCQTQQLEVEDIQLETTPTTYQEASSPKELIPLDEYERRYIVEVLERTGWVIKGKQGAAAILGLNESTLRHRMRKLGIKRKDRTSSSDS